MKIKSLNKPDERQLKEINELEQNCKTHDLSKSDLYLDNSMNFYQDMKNLFLHYENNVLVGLLSVFIPTDNEAEISGYVLPEFRNKGYFSLLIDKAIAELKKYNVENILFTTETESGKVFLEKINAKYSFSEYLMKYDLSKDFPKIEFKTKLNKNAVEDIDAIAQISQTLFNDSYDNSVSMVKSILLSDNRIQYSAVLGEEIIGLGSVCFEQDKCTIFGLGITPSYQGKGYGKELLLLIIKELLEDNHNEIFLEVESTNDIAYKMYLKSGFSIQTSVNYYHIKTDTIISRETLILSTELNKKT